MTEQMQDSFVSGQGNRTFMDEASSGQPIERRTFFAASGVALATLLIQPFAGGVRYAWADEDIAQNPDEWKIFVVKRWELPLFAVDPTVKDPKDRFIKGADISFTSLYNNKTFTGKTDEEHGVFIVDMRNGVAPKSRTTMDIYMCYAKVVGTKNGYRVFDSPQDVYRGGTSSYVVLQKSDDKPYARLICFDDYDVQYSKDAKFPYASPNESNHTFTVQIATKAGEKVEVSHYVDDKNWQTESATAGSDGLATVSFTNKYLFWRFYNNWKIEPGKRVSFQVKCSSGQFRVSTTYESKACMDDGNASPISESQSLNILSGNFFRTPDGEPEPCDTCWYIDSNTDQAKFLVVPQEVPIFGGMSLDIWLPTLPIYYDVNVLGKALFGVQAGMKGSFMRKKDGEPLESGWERTPDKSVSTQWQEECDKWSQALGLPTSKNKEKLDKDEVPEKPASRGKWGVSGKLEFKAELAAFAGMEWDWNKHKLDGKVAGLAKVGFKSEVKLRFHLGPVPAWLGFDGTFDVSLNPLLGFTSDYKNFVKSISWHPDLGVIITPSIEIGLTLGAGIDGVASLSVRGFGQISFTIGLVVPPGNNPYPHLVCVGKLGAQWSVQLLLLKASGTIWQKSWTLWGNWNTDKAMNEAGDDLGYVCEAFALPENEGGNGVLAMVGNNELKLTAEIQATSSATQAQAEVQEASGAETQTEPEPAAELEATANEKATSKDTQNAAAKTIPAAVAAGVVSAAVTPASEAEAKETKNPEIAAESESKTSPTGQADKNAANTEPAQIADKATSEPVEEQSEPATQTQAADNEPIALDDGLQGVDVNDVSVPADEYSYESAPLGDFGWTGVEFGAALTSIAGAGDRGVKPESEIKIYSQVFSAPKMKIVTSGNSTYLMRIVNVSYPQGIRSRITYARYENKAWSKPRVLEFGLKSTKYKRIDFFDYDFDACVNKAGKIYLLLIGGTRKDGDNTAVRDVLRNTAAFSMVITPNSDGSLGVRSLYERYLFMDHVAIAQSGHLDASLGNPTVTCVGDNAAAFAATMIVYKNVESVLRGDPTWVYAYMGGIDSSDHISDYHYTDTDDFETLQTGISPAALISDAHLCVKRIADGRAVVALVTSNQEPEFEATGCNMRNVIDFNFSITNTNDKDFHWAWTTGNIAGIKLENVTGIVPNGSSTAAQYPLLAALGGAIKEVGFGSDGKSFTQRDLGLRDCHVSNFAVSEDGSWIFYSSVKEGPKAGPVKSDGTMHVLGDMGQNGNVALGGTDLLEAIGAETEIHEYGIMAAKRLDGNFIEPFCFAELKNPCDSMACAKMNNATAFIFKSITELRTSRADIYVTAVPHVKDLQIKNFVSREPAVCAGEIEDFNVTVFNVGNTLIQKFTLQVLQDGKVVAEPEVVITPDRTVPDLNDVDAPLDATQMPGEGEFFDFIECDTTFDEPTKAGVLIPGKTRTYTTKFKIPEQWHGDVVLEAKVKPGSIEVSSVTQYDEPDEVEAIAIDGLAAYEHDSASTSAYVAQNESLWADQVDANTYAWDGNNNNDPVKQNTLAKTGDAASPMMGALGLVGAAGAAFAAYSARRAKLEAQSAQESDCDQGSNNE